MIRISKVNSAPDAAGESADMARRQICMTSSLCYTGGERERERERGCSWDRLAENKSILLTRQIDQTSVSLSTRY